MDRERMQEYLDTALDALLAAFLAAGGRLPDDVPDATLDGAFGSDRRVRKAKKAFTAALDALLESAPEDCHRMILAVEEAGNAVAAEATRLGWTVGLKVGRSARG